MQQLDRELDRRVDAPRMQVGAERRRRPPMGGLAFGPSRAVPLDPDRAASVVVDYGRAARCVDSRLDDDGLRGVLPTHAQVVGLQVLADALED